MLHVYHIRDKDCRVFIVLSFTAYLYWELSIVMECSPYCIDVPIYFTIVFPLHRCMSVTILIRKQSSWRQRKDRFIAILFSICINAKISCVKYLLGLWIERRLVIDYAMDEIHYAWRLFPM